MGLGTKKVETTALSVLPSLLTSLHAYLALRKGEGFASCVCARSEFRFIFLTGVFHTQLLAN